MGLTSLQVCMDSSDWLQGTINEESGMDSSSLSGDILSCSRPLTERRLRPQQDVALKCPRCDSTHTKFCYYNNYSLTQPRYFCKACRRYWTKGGTLRNIPVGGGCRKNKKVANGNKKSNDPIHQNQNQQQPISQIHHNHHNHQGSSSTSHHNPTDLHLSFPDQIQFPTHHHHFNPLIGTPNFISTIGMLETHHHNTRPIDFMDTKMDTLVGNGHYNASNPNHLAMVGGFAGDQIAAAAGHALSPSFHGVCSPYGLSLDGNAAAAAAAQGLMIPYEHDPNGDQNTMDVKPNTKLLALEWQDQGCSEKVESYGYMNGIGSSWNGMMNGYGSSTMNPLV